MRKPRELKESAYLQCQLPKIDIEEILDVHKKLSRMTTKKFWELFDTRTKIRKDNLDNKNLEVHGYDSLAINPKFDPNQAHFADTVNSTNDLAVPKSSDMEWTCEYCGCEFVASWSSADCEAHGFPNPLCPHCGRWEEVRFIQ